SSAPGRVVTSEKWIATSESVDAALTGRRYPQADLHLCTGGAEYSTSASVKTVDDTPTTRHAHEMLGSCLPGTTRCSVYTVKRSRGSVAAGMNDKNVVTWWVLRAGSPTHKDWKGRRS